MSVDTKAIILGVHAIDEIAAVLKDAGLIRDVQVNNSERFMFKDTRTGEGRAMWVFAGTISDRREIYDGPRTLVSLGASGASIEYVRILADTFGGFVLERDSEDDWTAVDAKREGFEVGPDTRLAIDIARLLGPEKAQAVRAVISDPEIRDGVIEALTRHRDAMLDVEPSMRA